jgi:hypothetical protein
MSGPRMSGESVKVVDNLDERRFEARVATQRQ